MWRLIAGVVICLIDRSIMENASGKTSSVFESAKLQFKTIVTRPHRFIFSKPFALIYVSPPSEGRNAMSEVRADEKWEGR